MRAHNLGGDRELENVQNDEGALVTDDDEPIHTRVAAQLPANCEPVAVPSRRFLRRLSSSVSQRAGWHALTSWRAHARTGTSNHTYTYTYEGLKEGGQIGLNPLRKIN